MDPTIMKPMDIMKLVTRIEPLSLALITKDEPINKHAPIAYSK